MPHQHLTPCTAGTLNTDYRVSKTVNLRVCMKRDSFQESCLFDTV